MMMMRWCICLNDVNVEGRRAKGDILSLLNLADGMYIDSVQYCQV